MNEEIRQLANRVLEIADALSPTPPSEDPVGSEGMTLMVEITGIPPGYKYDGAAQQNEEIVYFRPDNIELRGSAAAFIVKREDYGGRQYTGAQIENLGLRQSGTYYVDVDVEWLDNISSWIGFWLYDDHNGAEIDVLESVNHIGPTFNVHALGVASKLGPIVHRSPSINDGRKHTYGVRVTEQAISFYMDNVKSRVEETRPEVINFIRNSALFPKWLNSCGGTWAGDPTPESKFPHEVVFHRTRFYKP